MTPDRVEQVLRDYEGLRAPDADPELEAVRAAIFLEDAFGITLSDEEISPDVLGTAGGLRSVVLGDQGTA